MKIVSVLFALLMFVSLADAQVELYPIQPCRACTNAWPPRPADMISLDTTMNPNVAPDGYLHSPCSALEDFSIYTVPAGHRFILTWVFAIADLSQYTSIIERDASLNETVKRGYTGWGAQGTRSYSGTSEGGSGFGLIFQAGSQVILRFRNDNGCNPGQVQNTSYSMAGYLTN